MIPTYDQFIEPVLRYLAAYPEGAEASVVYEAAAVARSLTPEDRAHLLSSGKSMYRARVLWAHDRLKRAGLSEAPRRGVWRLTHAGIEFARSHPWPLPGDLVAKLATKSDGARLRAQPTARKESLPSNASAPTLDLESVLKGYHDAAAKEVRERAHSASGARFRTLVCDLLRAEGYGEALPTDQVGDSVQGLFVTVASASRPSACVLAKQLTHRLGDARVREFHESVLAHGLEHGVFLSTSGFNSGAKRFAEGVPTLRLIGGALLAELMLVHRLGIAARTVEIPHVDAAYFLETRPSSA